MKNRALIVGANMNNSQFEYSFQECDKHHSLKNPVE